MRYLRFETPIGTMDATASDRGLRGLYFVGGRHAPDPVALGMAPVAAGDGAAVHLQACRAQVLDYLAGARRTFALALDPQGTPFQHAVWRAIAAIPYGETVTYAELARAARAPDACRAAGAATGRNPLSLIVPCHRVVGSSGGLTGYAGGLERKRRLLTLEGALMPSAA